MESFTFIDVLASSSPKVTTKQKESSINDSASTQTDQTRSESTVPLTSQSGNVEGSQEEAIKKEDSEPPEPPTERLYEAVYDPEMVESLKVEDYHFDFYSDHVSLIIL